MINSVLLPTLLWMTRTQQQVDHVLCTYLKQWARCAGGRKTLSSRERVILGWICLEQRLNLCRGPSVGRAAPAASEASVEGQFLKLSEAVPPPSTAVWKGTLYRYLSHHYSLKSTHFAWAYAKELTKVMFSQDTHSGGKASWRTCPALLSSLLCLLVLAPGSCLSWASSTAFRAALKPR